MKKLSNAHVSVKDKTYQCLLNVSLTNLGERITIVLTGAPEENSNASLEDTTSKKRKAVKTINRLKPPTALTHLNLKNLINIIEKHSGFNYSVFINSFLNEGLIDSTRLELIDEDKRFIKLLSGPYPRKQVVKAASAALGQVYYDVEIDHYDEVLAKRLDKKTAESIRAIPIEKTEEHIRIACANPFDENAKKILSQHFELPLEILMSCEEDIRYELEKIYQRSE